MKISPLSFTSVEFSNQIRAQLGKGAEHALLLYQEWYRAGTLSSSHPAFANAENLFRQMKELIDTDLLEPVQGRTDGQQEKLLFKTHEGFEVESVLISMEAGGTLCISSQVGCRMGCRFCETGRMGLLKNLSPKEIAGQVHYASQLEGSDVRNVVFMGMGEPFDNYDAMMQAFRVINDPRGLNIGAKHITISTSGKVDEIRRFADEPGPCPFLAVSINAPTDEIRTKLMPINRAHSMADLYQAIQYYTEKTSKQVLAAYVLIKDVNDSLEHAALLASYLKGLDVKVNLISYNAQSHDRYQAPEMSQVLLFKELLMAEGYQVLVRKSRGEQIMAACGQLGNKKFLHRNGK
jgi:23S rRNA (adenine2503-C2)-methyltransferase